MAINRARIFETAVLKGGKAPRMWGHKEIEFDRKHDAMPYAVGEIEPVVGGHALLVRWTRFTDAGIEVSWVDSWDRWL